MGIYDPLGYVCPLTVRLRWLVQELGKGQLGKGWDDPLVQDEKGPWIDILTKMVEMGSITFSRSCKPVDADLTRGTILIN